MPFYFGHSVWFSFRDGAISFGHLFLGIPFDFSTGMVPLSFWSIIFLVIPFDFLTGMVPLLLVIYFWSWPVFQEWCHFHFKPVERDILALFLLRSILDTMRPFLISSICRICFYFSSYRHWYNGGNSFSFPRKSKLKILLEGLVFHQSYCFFLNPFLSSSLHLFHFSFIHLHCPFWW